MPFVAWTEDDLKHAPKAIANLGSAALRCASVLFTGSDRFSGFRCFEPFLRHCGFPELWFRQLHADHIHLKPS